MKLEWKRTGTREVIYEAQGIDGCVFRLIPSPLRAYSDQYRPMIKHKTSLDFAFVYVRYTPLEQAMRACQEYSDKQAAMLQKEGE